jgi:steroid delta-isomerase-like uncharacterized protein
MEETMLKSETLSVAQTNMLDYFQTHDVKYVTEDAVFRNLSTGESYTGRADIGAMLHYVYHVAFDAKAVISNYIITEENAMLEGMFKGKHVGEFMGIPATNKDVNVPLCVTYDLKDGLIKEARIFMMGTVLLQQIGVTNKAPKQKVSFLVRDIFQLKFGQFRPAKKLLEEAMEKNMMPEAQQARVLTDFTGDSYRLVFEEGFDSLTDYEMSLSGSMKSDEWQSWYERFKPLVERSHREILKQVL